MRPVQDLKPLIVAPLGRHCSYHQYASRDQFMLPTSSHAFIYCMLLQWRPSRNRFAVFFRIPAIFSSSFDLAASPTAWEQALPMCPVQCGIQVQGAHEIFSCMPVLHTLYVIGRSTICDGVVLFQGLGSGSSFRVKIVMVRTYR